MAAVLGVAAADVEAACRTARTQTGQEVVPANFNGPGQIVIAGHAEAVEAAMDILKARGVRKMMKLPVSAPFHSPLMEPARVRMEPVLQALVWSVPSCPLVNNVDAVPVMDPSLLLDGLVRQIPGAVRWEALTARLLDEGVTTFYELGPGKVLSGLVKRQAKEAGLEVAAFAIGAPDDFKALAR